MEQIVKEMIAKSKSNLISYSEYMETVLYHPQKGYYMNSKKKLGASGDFYTSAHIHPVFASVIAKLFVKLISSNQIKPIFCEIGGGDGAFAYSFLKEIQRILPDSCDEIIYYVVETSPFHRENQYERLSQFKNIRIFGSLSEMQETIPTFQGFVFSNELLDAFPVDVVVQREDNLYEVKIGLTEGGELEERFVICDKKEIINWLTRFDYSLMDNQRLEIPVVMTEWLAHFFNWLGEAFVVTIDYGYIKEEWQQPEHRQGSLRGYFNHQFITNPLLHIGEMDLTTHIHLDVVEAVGEENGMNNLVMMNQRTFLLRSGILKYLQENYDTNPFSEKSKQNRAIRSLVMDGGISSAFQVIVQTKGLHSIVLEEILPKDYLNL